MKKSLILMIIVILFALSAVTAFAQDDRTNNAKASGFTSIKPGQSAYFCDWNGPNTFCGQQKLTKIDYLTQKCYVTIYNRTTGNIDTTWVLEEWESIEEGSRRLGMYCVPNPVYWHLQIWWGSNKTVWFETYIPMNKYRVGPHLPEVTPYP